MIICFILNTCLWKTTCWGCGFLNLLCSFFEGLYVAVLVPIKKGNWLDDCQFISAFFFTEPSEIAGILSVLP